MNFIECNCVGVRKLFGYGHINKRFESEVIGWLGLVGVSRMPANPIPAMQPIVRNR
jgi:hypothetical protein